MSALDNTWRKSARSGGQGACVEVRYLDTRIQVRDSKELGSGPILSFSRRDWATFTDGLQQGEFDLR